MTIVVPVLMTSCQVSLKWKSGPVTAQSRMTRTASPNVTGWPEARAVAFANRVNHSPIVIRTYIPSQRGTGLWRASLEESRVATATRDS